MSLAHLDSVKLKLEESNGCVIDYKIVCKDFTRFLEEVRKSYNEKIKPCPLKVLMKCNKFYKFLFNVYMAKHSIEIGDETEEPDAGKQKSARRRLSDVFNPEVKDEKESGILNLNLEHSDNGRVVSSQGIGVETTLHKMEKSQIKDIPFFKTVEQGEFGALVLPSTSQEDNVLGKPQTAVITEKPSILKFEEIEKSQDSKFATLPASAALESKQGTTELISPSDDKVFKKPQSILSPQKRKSTSEEFTSALTSTCDASGTKQETSGSISPPDDEVFKKPRSIFSPRKRAKSASSYDYSKSSPTTSASSVSESKSGPSVSPPDDEVFKKPQFRPRKLSASSIISPRKRTEYSGKLEVSSPSPTKKEAFDVPERVHSHSARANSDSNTPLAFEGLAMQLADIHLAEFLALENFFKFCRHQTYLNLKSYESPPEQIVAFDLKEEHDILLRIFRELIYLIIFVKTVYLQAYGETDLDIYEITQNFNSSDPDCEKLITKLKSSKSIDCNEMFSSKEVFKNNLKCLWKDIIDYMQYMIHYLDVFYGSLFASAISAQPEFKLNCGETKYVSLSVAELKTKFDQEQDISETFKIFKFEVEFMFQLNVSLQDIYSKLIKYVKIVKYFK